MWRLCTIAVVMALNIIRVGGQNLARKDRIHPRIISGDTTTIEDHPYQVQFHVQKGNESSFCGGFIISDEHIVTAAHCVDEVTDPSAVTLRVGSTYRDMGLVVPLAEVVAHPDYNTPPYDNDVAVLRTAEKLTFSEAVQPVALPEMDRPVKAGSKVYVTGWGQTVRGDAVPGSLSEELMEARMPVMALEVCQAILDTVTENEFCAGDLIAGVRSTCFGDSGGAAVQDGLAVGIVSYGRSCGRPMSPSVFANVAAEPIRSFIDYHTGV